MKNKSSKIISIGNMGNSCVNTHKIGEQCFQWNVGLIPIQRLHPNLNFCSRGFEQHKLK